jgi:hypothetical protein
MYHLRQDEGVGWLGVEYARKARPSALKGNAEVDFAQAVGRCGLEL